MYEKNSQNNTGKQIMCQPVDLLSTYDLVNWEVFSDTFKQVTTIEQVKENEYKTV